MGSRVGGYVHESGARLPGFGFLLCDSGCVNLGKWLNLSVFQIVFLLEK